MILFGGGGILGNELSEYYENSGYELINISLEFPYQENNESIGNVIGDINSSVFILPLMEELVKKYGRIHTAFFIIAPETGLLSRILELLKTHCDSVVLISTIYADDNVRCDHPYFDKKRNEEKVISASGIEKQYIFRLPHIIGKNTFIGCVPPYNRMTIDRIAKSKLLRLHIDSDISIYHLDPIDIPVIIDVLYDLYASAGCTVNLFNPNVGTAVEYFKELAGIASLSSKVECVGVNKKEGFWSFTTMEMSLDTELMDKLARGIEFTSLRSSLTAAVNTSVNIIAYSGDLASRVSSYDS